MRYGIGYVDMICKLKFSSFEFFFEHTHFSLFATKAKKENKLKINPEKVKTTQNLAKIICSWHANDF